jgi:DNA-binding NtrC family response regulator
MSATNTFTPTSHPIIDPARKQEQVKSTCRVLVVDDEVSIREFIAEALADCDYEVDTAENAVSAFEKLQTANFDALLTDYHMPKRTGRDLVLQMQSQGISIPTIMMTGQSTELRARHPDLQVNALLEKPFMIQELLDILTNILEPTMRSALICQFR